MEAGFKTRLFLTTLATGLLVVAQGGAQSLSRSPAAEKPKAAGEDALMKCLYTPAADQQSSSLPTSGLGFKFILQKNNGNQLAVDIYSLNDDSQPIKQIGHADLVGGTSEISEKTALTKILSNITLADDSPFDFAISFNSDASESDSGTRFSAVVDSLVTFLGEEYTAVPVQCRIQKHRAGGEKTTRE